MTVGRESKIKDTEQRTIVFIRTALGRYLLVVGHRALCGIGANRFLCFEIPDYMYTYPPSNKKNFLHHDVHHVKFNRTDAINM